MSSSRAPNDDRRDSPIFTDLSREQSVDLLSRHQVGRIAYTFHDRVDIEPIHYVYNDGWVYGRTSIGTKLATIAHHRWVAFEVDESSSLFDWESVVVHGALYVVEPPEPSEPNPTFELAVDLLSRLIPETLSAGDPVPFRSVVFRIHVDEIRGRRASSKHETTQ